MQPPSIMSYSLFWLSVPTPTTRPPPIQGDTQDVNNPPGNGGAYSCDYSCVSAVWAHPWLRHFLRERVIIYPLLSSLSVFNQLALASLLLILLCCRCWGSTGGCGLRLESAAWSWSSCWSLSFAYSGGTGERKWAKEIIWGNLCGLRCRFR